MKKILFFFFAFFFILFTFVSPVFAQANNNRTLPQNQTINGDYFAGGSTVTVQGTVNGDAYVAGGTVIIDGTVKGDVIAAGGTVTINGTAQNVRVMGGTVNINGTVEKNISVAGGTVSLEKNAKVAGSIVAAGGTINILAPVGKGATIGGGTVVINNAIGGDVNAGVGQLTLQSQAKINGDLYYTSNQKAQVMQGATVSGETKQSLPPQPKEEQKHRAFLGLAGAALIFKSMEILSYLILGLLLVFFTPNYVKRTANIMMDKPWLSLGVGVISLILAPIIAFILFITIIGLPLAILFIITFAIFVYFAKLVFIYLIGAKIGSSLHSKIHMAWLFVIGLIIYEIILLIPILGWLLELVAVFFGLGALLIQEKHLYSSLRKNKEL